MVTKSYFLSELEREQYEQQLLLAEQSCKAEELLALDDEELLQLYKEIIGKQSLVS
ncbi:hypothetical protein [Ectobacillus ponti]|uniref:Uncharacterized protein n=1 Tax=Ectobacillus ponti TaxID=2961894 RepID=A0AA42BTV5_9BACI|nr:hypothetical protein [Ectobacillus ponti]MCP8969883.1 hypothetical protein [Ectobacillus ponti]